MVQHQVLKNFFDEELRTADIYGPSHTQEERMSTGTTGTSGPQWQEQIDKRLFGTITRLHDIMAALSVLQATAPVLRERHLLWFRGFVDRRAAQLGLAIDNAELLDLGRAPRRKTYKQKYALAKLRALSEEALLFGVFTFDMEF